jgi:hypothetical protein
MVPPPIVTTARADLLNLQVTEILSTTSVTNDTVSVTKKTVATTTSSNAAPTKIFFYGASAKNLT